MDYKTAMKSFDVQAHLKMVHDLSKFEVIQESNRSYKWAEGVRIPKTNRDKRSIEYMIHEYVDAVRGLSFFLQCGMKPGGVNEEVFQSFRPLMENLVKKKQLLPSVLKLFDAPVNE